MESSEIEDFPAVRRNTLPEMREILDAIEAGKAIQYKYVGDGETVSWIDTINTSPNFTHRVYRVKPEEAKKHWRPFDGITELHDAIDRHGAWVINTYNHQHCQIVAYDQRRALIGQTTYTYEEILHNFIFVDGTPCGVEE